MTETLTKLGALVSSTILSQLVVRGTLITA